ncbi:MAG: hypothetical protein RIQ89_2410 [Bacteroidota bacterium]|jgi:uncharacterized protein
MKKLFAFFLLSMVMLNHALALDPSTTYASKPEKYGMTYKEEKIATKDGATLNAWFFELPKKTSNWIVISNSGDGNMASDIEKAGMFLSAGWNVAMYDYRGYGSSSEFSIDPALFIYPQFALDLNAVLDYLRKSRAITKFDLYGTGIGAGLSLGIGCNRSETRKIIADGPWTNLETMKKKIKDKLQKEVNLPFGFDKNYEPTYACEKPAPFVKGKMVIVSMQDPLITANDTKQLKGINDTYMVKASPNNAQNFETDKDTYFKRIASFLNQ